MNLSLPEKPYVPANLPIFNYRRKRLNDARQPRLRNPSGGSFCQKKGHRPVAGWPIGPWPKQLLRPHRPETHLNYYSRDYFEGGLDSDASGEAQRDAKTVYNTLRHENICRSNTLNAHMLVGAALAIVRGATCTAATLTFRVDTRQVSRWAAKLRELHEKRPTLLQNELSASALPSPPRPPPAAALDIEFARNEKKKCDTTAQSKRRKDPVKRKHDNETRKKRRDETAKRSITLLR
ncbi:hypothetical protein T492DRAFT_831609 [Pavlovales sp. CCMP2436]|nr:hypothetical protein T492DRAFT_831609 [Pavlovales sp. CCMP2436]